MAARRMLITGGAGFIGANAARRFGGRYDLSIVDDLSRPGGASNLEWLRDRTELVFHRVDIRDVDALERVVAQVRPDVVLHMAAQVAVTLSVQDPRRDFESNCLGTLNLLEALRRHCPQAVLVFASTNKVYGEMADAKVRDAGGRYAYEDLPHGVSERTPLCFHSPYGCSKGAADQYVLDYGRIYGLRTVVLRQSCIYGYRQFGIEDQGWVAWFVIAAVTGRPLTIYGDGKQVRDVLFIDDLLDCFERAIEFAGEGGSEAFNIGGGPDNTLSLLELLELLGTEHGLRVQPAFADWRPGDQKVYISDIRKAQQLLKWRPKVGVREGVAKLVEWIRAHRELFQSDRAAGAPIESYPPAGRRAARETARGRRGGRSG